MVHDDSGTVHGTPAEAVMALKRAGWSIGDAAFVGESGERVWVVSGHNGENLIRAEGATEDEAWRLAVELAQEVGMGGRLIRVLGWE